MGSFGHNDSVLWLNDTEGALCCIYKEDIGNTCHIFLDCPQFKENFGSVSCNLQLKLIRPSPTDGIQIANFIKNPNRQKILVDGLPLSPY